MQRGNMKIAIIGSGWLGLPLANQLQTDGHKMMLTTTQQDKAVKLQRNGLNVMQYEVGDQLSQPDQLFNNDIIIIAVTSKDVDAFDILIDQLNQQTCKKLIYISSTSVYQNNRLSHDESSQYLNKDNPIWKIEQLIQTHPSTTIIRLAGLVGPGRHPGRFFKNGRTLKNPTAPVNLIHLDDCIGIIQSVILNQAWNQIFNGCADNHPPKLEFYTRMADQLNLAAPEFEKNTAGSQKIVDNKKSKTVLGYKYTCPDVFNMKY